MNLVLHGTGPGAGDIRSMTIMKYRIPLLTICAFAFAAWAEPQPLPSPIPLLKPGNNTAGTPPPVGGIDFWKHDATHVPSSPVRNLMPNPSFEQGLRFWRWEGGGGTYTPSAIAKNEILKGGLFGSNALAFHAVRGKSIHSFPIALDNGKTYVLSFHAKATRPCTVTAAFSNAGREGTLSGAPWGDANSKEAQFKVGPEWKRYHRTFIADTKGVMVHFGSSDEVLIDGVQLEPGTEPTDFVSAPVEAELVTAHPDNDLVTGRSIDAQFVFSGKAGTRAKVSAEVYNAYREVLARQTFAVAIGADGRQTLPLPLDPATLGEGVFIVKLEIRADGLAPYYEFHRLSIMRPLANLHPTKNIFGTLFTWGRIPRGEDCARKLMEWGWGSTSWFSVDDARNPLLVSLMRKYRFTNVQTSIGGSSLFTKMFPKEKELWKNSTLVYAMDKVPPEMEAFVEEEACKVLKDIPVDMLPYVAFGNEEEGQRLPVTGQYDEYFKWQHALARGAKRANPQFKITPTSGTTSLTDGKLVTYEGYLKAAHKKGFKYDAVAVHPYGIIDGGTLGGGDLNVMAPKLIKLMEKYGYGRETPIFFTECFNIPETYVPAWGADRSYDAYQSGKPTYDLGNREFMQAATVARLYIHCLKFWPQVQSANIWMTEPFLDIRLTPLMVCKAVNTLGHFMPDVAWKADIMPDVGVRGFVFTLRDGTAIAPVWCINADVDNAVAEGLVIHTKFSQQVQYCDMMGNPRVASVDTQGMTRIQLTPAPLYLKAKDADLLARELMEAKTGNSALAVAVSFLPQENGTIMTRVSNLTGLERSGRVLVEGQTLPYKVAPSGEQTMTIPGGDKTPVVGKMYKWDTQYKVLPDNAPETERKWKMDYVYVPEVTTGDPDWSTIPVFTVTNRHEAKGLAPRPGDHDAQYQLAWGSGNLYLRVEVADDPFLFEPSLADRIGDQMLYSIDGCLELYFDTCGNGRSNLKKGFDLDDYRYDFAVANDGKDGPGRVYRLREAFHQFADGLNMPTKQEAAEKIKSEFRRTPKGYVYTITMAERYLMPAVLKKGSVLGFALYLHDHDAPHWKDHKGLSSATEPGAHADFNPHFWPLIILK
jgi:hypothetical protein